MLEFISALVLEVLFLIELELEVEKLVLNILELTSEPTLQRRCKREDFLNPKVKK